MTANKELVLDLAKLVVSASWADGELTNEEVNALKDLLFSLDDVSAEDWIALKMYMESPAGEQEQEQLRNRVGEAIRNKDDRELVFGTLEKLFACDGKVTPAEADLMASLKEDIGKVNIFAGLAKSLRSAIGLRKERVNESCLRECDSDDYVKNTIFYDLTRKQESASVTIDRPEPEVRKLCLATGLLAHVANVDSVISDEEKDAMGSVIAEDWGLSGEQAGLLISICCDRTTKGMDYFRLSHGYFECTNLEERRQFLRTLFRIANAANKTDNDEIEEIRRISRSLKLSHKDFIDAKLTVPRGDRDGL